MKMHANTWAQHRASPAKEEKRDVFITGTRYESEEKMSEQEESYLVLARLNTGGFFIILIRG